MTKAEIVEIVAKGVGLSKVETNAVVDGFLATVMFSLQSGKHVELRGFGTFCLRERVEKHTPNPRTGKMMEIPHRIVPDFKPSPKFKRLVAQTMIAGDEEPIEEEIPTLDRQETVKPEISEQSENEQTDIFRELDELLHND